MGDGEDFEKFEKEMWVVDIDEDKKISKKEFDYMMDGLIDHSTDVWEAAGKWDDPI